MSNRLQKWWNRYRHVSAVRSLLQWVGVWDKIVACLTGLAIWVWANSSQLALVQQVVLALVAFVAVLGSFSLAVYLSQTLTTKKAIDPLPRTMPRALDAHGKEYVRPQKPPNTFLPRLLVTLAIIGAVALLWINYGPDPDRVLHGARLEFVEITGGLVPGKDGTAASLHFGAKVYYQNTGKLPASAVKVSFAFSLTPSASKITREEEIDGIQAARASADRQKTTDSEMQPGERWFFIPASEYLSNEAVNQIRAGQKLVYLYLVATYRDARLRKNETLVTESCLYFNADLKSYVLCNSSHRIYLESR